MCSFTPTVALGCSTIAEIFFLQSSALGFSWHSSALGAWRVENCTVYAEKWTAVRKGDDQR